MTSTDRRGFIGSLAAAFALPAMGVARVGLFAGPRLMVTHCRHMEEVTDQVDEGIRKGVREANLAAASVGGSVEYRYFSFGGSPIFGQPYPPPPPITAARDAIQIVIPGIMGPELMKHTIDSSQVAGAIVFNANYRRDDVYRVCRRHVFHVRPSSEPMGADSSAWGGWFAVKCAWEAALQSKAVRADDLIVHLEKPGTVFDGIGGVPLAFNANHELVNGAATPVSATKPGVCR
jgi:hypothetical protein